MIIIVIVGLVTEGISQMLALQCTDRISIQHLKTISTSIDKFIYSVCWNGVEIVAGANNAILTFSEYNSTNRVNIRGDVSCMRKAGDHAFAILHHKNDTDREVRISSIRTLYDPKSTVFRFNQDVNSLMHLSISDQYIAVCDHDQNVVNLWTPQGQFKMAVGKEILSFPCGVLLLRDHLLVAGNTDKCLYKFKLDSNSAKLIWTCKDLDSSTGICVDKHGFIHVARNKGGVIYLISPDGKLPPSMIVA